MLEKSKMSNAGFTLVEVLMAMVILLVGLLAVGSMQIMAMRGNQHARESTVRTTATDNVIEWLMSQDFNSNNLRETESGTPAAAQHVINIDDDGSLALDDGDADSTNDDTAPPSNLFPPPDRSKNRIKKVQWEVAVETYLDDGTTPKDFNTSPADYDSGDTITSKRIEVTVKWEGGGSTTISNIKPLME